MIETVRNLFRHEAWADVEMFRAIQGCAAAWEDPHIRQRLHHSHTVQLAYLGLFRGMSPNVEEMQRPFTSFDELRVSANRYHGEVRELLATLSVEELSEPIVIPWLEGCRPTLAQAMLQLVMHSQYHRGQNASRLRELGGEPPQTDFIFWVWKSPPEPEGAP